MWVCGYEIVGVMYRLRLRQLSRSTTRKSKSKAPSGSPGGVLYTANLRARLRKVSIFAIVIDKRIICCYTYNQGQRFKRVR